ncbi:ABC transporter permease [Chryseobacterium sp. YR221]|uniref:ABC transporter permease n=1 Tax=Chryseobacterium sp. YR221 TaxID=1500293 RepID=UPI0009D8CE82|nr:ABC transporter permease [Chryseobacterium sp. YR221]SMC99270.1 ABC-2 type transport system permease protein [Chryseobacterium sp. YR221]
MTNNLFFRIIKTIFKAFQAELIHFFGDPALRTTFLIITLVVAFLNSSIYSNEIIEKTPIAVVDLDKGSMSRNYIRMLDATQQVSVPVVSNDMNEAKKEFIEGKVFGILVIPEDFEQKISLGRQSSILLYSDASNMLHNKAISGAAASVMGTFNAQIEIGKSLRSGLNYGNSTISRRSITAITKPVFNPYGGYGTFLLPVVFLIVMQTLLLTSIGVLGGTFREQNKYLEAYRISDSTHLKIIPVLLGRALAYLLLCILVFSVIVGGTFTIFKLPFRAAFGDVIVFLIPFFLAVIFLGFSLMGIFKRREDAAMSVTFLSTPAVFLTGISWPVVAFPQWVKILSYAFPSTVGARGFLALSQFQASLGDIKDLWGQMWLTAVFYFVIAILVNYRLKIS